VSPEEWVGTSGIVGNPLTIFDSEHPKINRVKVRQTIVQCFEVITILSETCIAAPKVLMPLEA
jgi:hypothetical protein